MGRARWLFDFLVSKQTDDRGRVYYGRAITYGWIAKRIPNAPTKRSLRHWMDALRRHGYVETVKTREGLAVRILEQKKFAQRSLFPSEKPLVLDRPKMGYWAAQKWTEKSYIEKRSEKGGGFVSTARLIREGNDKIAAAKGDQNATAKRNTNGIADTGPRSALEVAQDFVRQLQNASKR